MSTEITNEKKARKVPGITNYYVAMAVDIILLYVLNNLRYLNISILTDKFTSCLWAINLALGFGIIANFILLLYRPRWFYHLVQAVLSALALFAVYIVYKIFPFNLNEAIFQTAARIILIVIMAGSGIGLIVELVRFYTAFIHKDQKPTTPVPPIIPQPPTIENR